MRAVANFAAGLLFGLGLAVSGLINPAKVLTFLDIAGAWDPSLAATMGAAVAVTYAGYRLVLRRRAPLLDCAFHLPAPAAIDNRLLGGAMLFGVGWGLVGFCPGPALAALSSGSERVVLFVAAMFAGMAVARWLGHSGPVLNALPNDRN
jgi:uncharacterized membrane protein YedE/YeeE